MIRARLESVSSAADRAAGSGRGEVELRLEAGPDRRGYLDAGHPHVARRTRYIFLVDAL